MHCKNDAWTQTSYVKSVTECVNRIISYCPTSPLMFDDVEYEKMKIEKRRFLTLVKEFSYVEAKAIAQAGLFLHMQVLQCAFCLNKFGLDEFRKSDNPLALHASKCGRCPFICKLPVGNVKPRYKSLADIPLDVTYCGYLGPEDEIFY